MSFYESYVTVCVLGKIQFFKFFIGRLELPLRRNKFNIRIKFISVVSLENPDKSYFLGTSLHSPCKGEKRWKSFKKFWFLKNKKVVNFILQKFPIHKKIISKNCPKVLKVLWFLKNKKMAILLKKKKFFHSKKNSYRKKLSKWAWNLQEYLKLEWSNFASSSLSK